jgi:hypothetical protein
VDVAGKTFKLELSDRRLGGRVNGLRPEEAWELPAQVEPDAPLLRLRD